MLRVCVCVCVFLFIRSLHEMHKMSVESEVHTDLPICFFSCII